MAAIQVPTARRKHTAPSHGNLGSFRPIRRLRDAEPLREAVAFHCHQAAEKYLKAFLVSQSVQFPKTYSIGQLLDLVSPVAPEIAMSLEEVGVLTPFGVELRYPGDFPDVLPGEEKTAFGLARRARETIMSRLDPFLSAA